MGKRCFHGVRLEHAVWGLLLSAGCLICVLAIGFPRLNTRYAPGYSEAAFMAIAVGDSEKRVLDLLGEPLERKSDVYYDSTREYLRYTRPRGRRLEHYLLRNIVIEEGRVVEAYRMVWWD